MPLVRDGHRIRRAYESRGLSRMMFAKLVELTPRSVTNICTGRHGRCSYPAAVRIARVLGWKVNEIIDGAPEPDVAVKASETAEQDDAAARGAA